MGKHRQDYLTVKYSVYRKGKNCYCVLYKESCMSPVKYNSHCSFLIFYLVTMNPIRTTMKSWARTKWLLGTSKIL